MTWVTPLRKSLPPSPLADPPHARRNTYAISHGKTHMINLTTIAAASATLLAASATQPEQAGVDLAPKFTEGERDRYDLTIDADTNMSMLGSSQVIASYMESRFVVNVLDTSSELTRVEVSFERVLVQFDGLEALDGSYDTASKIQPDPDAVLPKIVRPVIDSPVTLGIDGWGEIVTIEGLESLAPDGPAGAFFLHLFDDEAMYSMFQPVFRIRPQQDGESPSPVTAVQEVGSTWNATQPEIRSLNVRRQMLDLTLESARGTTAQIVIEGKPSERVPENAEGMPGVKTTEAVVTGTATWDTADGELETLKTKSLLELGTDSGGFGIDISVTSTTQLDRLD